MRTRQWLAWLAILTGVAVAMLAIRSRLDKAHVALAFLLVVLGGSAAEGRALGVALATLAFLIFNWAFLPPYYTFVIADPVDWLVLFAFLATGVVAAELLERQRREAKIARRRAEEIDRLATLGAETLNAPRAVDALEAIAGVIREAMRTERCAIFLYSAEGGVRLAGRSPADNAPEEHLELLSYTVSNAEVAAKRADGTLSLLGEAFQAPSGDDSNGSLLSDLVALGIPLSVRGRVVGALRLSSSQPFTLAPDQRRILGALSYYAALGVERMRLSGAEEEAESLRRADALKDALLASVSHDLRTPLTAIKGIANEIWRGGDGARAQTIEEEADRLTRMVNDLLELSQLNAGVLRPALEVNAVDDVVGAALERVESAHGTGRITARVTNNGEILAGMFDFVHTMRALTNLLENALKYSAPDAPVLLLAARVGERLQIVVEDRGPGVPAGSEQRIFEPFYRASTVPDGVRGTGLGLSIARQLIATQQGTLTYEPRVEGGSRFVIDLPAAAVPLV